MEELGTEFNINELGNDFINHLNNVDPFNALQELLNSLPSAAAILNSQRKVIFVNYFLLNSLEIESFESLFGKRPGEILNCLHALENENQCGISESCKVCGAMQALRKTETTNKIAISEMRLAAIQRGVLIARDFKITVSPLLLNDHSYMIMYLNDISNEKRRLVLERIFFHDVLNKVSSLRGMISLLNPNKISDRFNDHMSTIKLIVEDLTSEIISQRQLVAAENGELELNIGPVDVTELINRIVKQAQQFKGPIDIIIKIEHENENIKIGTDQNLLNRIITNMLKNAIEASSSNDTVTLKTNISENNLTIAVHNESFIPEDVQLQIFNRSFSTKGADRGLGTYSIKLLTERYLKGKVYFKSSSKNGTTFYIKLPIKF